MTATQDDTIAELQRTIAELRRERDAAQAQRNSEYGDGSAQPALESSDCPPGRGFVRWHVVLTV